MMARTKKFRLTIIQPCIGRHADHRRYIRAWQMESLAAATLAGLTPPDVETRFYDDRMGPIPFDEPTDLVALTVETYTARRAYQLASEYRRRGVPVVMGGFHATLVPEEVAQYAESVVVGEADDIWKRVLDDARHGRPEKIYRQATRPTMAGLRPDRRIFAGKRYLPIRLIEHSRGCEFNCEFCAVQTMFKQTQIRRPVDEIIAEIERIKRHPKMLFFVDDNIAADLGETKEFLRALIPLNVRWVSQTSIHATQDEELLDLMHRSGCQAVLIGFESLNPANLRQMNKNVNVTGVDFATALDTLCRHRIAVYGTFVFGYDHDTPESFRDVVDFAVDQGLYIAAFAHVMPFPGTPLYARLHAEGRLLHEAWWLDDGYRYNRVPFRPTCMTPDQVRWLCQDARRRFYRWPSILRRSRNRANRADFFMLRTFFLVNAMHRADVTNRDGFPLGDESWSGPLIKAG
ncbi:MAG: B12-binding domain-containing radical SAM protein [Phycisphaerales bacterium]|nr:MAG: B12-binding domain-containing radical SAM protein [Phycisphaerales bacterium]